jgi:hypothetical protein
MRELLLKFRHARPQAQVSGAQYLNYKLDLAFADVWP